MESSATTLAELVLALGMGEARIATAINGGFVPHGARTRTVLNALDRIEIVSPRQGG